ncbi:hypothetical protein HUJ04_006053, partial [Dendroctonus ponderosae]
HEDTVVSLLIQHPVQGNPKEFFILDEFEGADFHHEHFDHENVSSTLFLSYVLFRHGNRTPDSVQEMYPNDPYLIETYYPTGLGQLTNAGKIREFNIGTSLRQRYSRFLSELYLPEEVEAFSTDYSRTKASLQLVLAGLFPPQGPQLWNPSVLWQPVPYRYAPRGRDSLLMGGLCPTYLQLYQEMEESIEMRSKFMKHHTFFEYISRHSGLEVSTFRHIYNLYFGLSTEEEWGFSLPDWTQPIWPRKVTAVAIHEYYVQMANDRMWKLASGHLLRKILHDTETKIAQLSKGCKIHLYSAHENNVVQLLILLGVFWPHIPCYGAHVILEVHHIEEEFGIKVFYQNWEVEHPELLQIPGCDVFCPLDQFRELFSKYMPEDDECGY